MVKSKTPEFLGFTEYSLLRESCGMSHEDAALMLDISPDQSRNYEIGRRTVPDQVLHDLQELYKKVHRAAATGKEPKGALRRGVARRTLEMQIMKDAKRDAWMEGRK